MLIMVQVDLKTPKPSHQELVGQLKIVTRLGNTLFTYCRLQVRI